MELPKLTPRKLVNVLFDEYHSESWSVSRSRAEEIQPDYPENSSYARASDLLTAREFVVNRNLDRPIDPAILRTCNVVAFIHPCDPKYERTTSVNPPKLSRHEIMAVHEFVRNGGGLFVVTEYENDKYGNNLNELVSEFGIVIDNSTVSDRILGINEEKTHVPGLPGPDAENLLMAVNKTYFYRGGSCTVRAPARAIMCGSTTSRPKNACMLAVAEYGLGRVVVVCDSDLFGDECIRQFDHEPLWLNLMYWISERAFLCDGEKVQNRGGETASIPEWLILKERVNALRQLHVQKRQPDNTYISETRQLDDVRTLVGQIVECISALKVHFPHDQDYLDSVIEDFRKWASIGFQRPDFSNSLRKFNPQLLRRPDIEHLVVFPLYTPNHSLDIYFEALIIRVPWHDWLAAVEKDWFPRVASGLWPGSSAAAESRFRNPKFVPGRLVDFTQGYESECAVLFPETVSVDEPANNSFGVIFCDREALRYQRCVSRCVDIVKVNAPPDLVSFLRSLDLIEDMFALWDLVHDTSHSMGPLPFDPFMVRQLSPYWMYGLEELRVDLRSVRIAMRLVEQGFPFARTVGYGVIFDRIFRFAITGSRVKNYDGLGGQLLFAALHRKGVLTWENNQLTIQWDKIFGAIEALSGELEEVYDAGADQSRVRRFIEGHSFVSRYLHPAVNSRFSQSSSVTLPETDFRGWISQALDDEFPLGSFHVQLKKKYEATLA